MIKKQQRILTGNRYGKLIVMRPMGQCRDNDKHFYSLVKCDCNKEFLVRDSLLVNNTISQCKNCGRDSVRTHCLTKSPLYHVWQGMRARCYRNTEPEYKNYGGRGIIVCQEWKNDFKVFYDWAMAHGYKEGLSIDRIDVNGNYEPSNCRWADRLIQARNKRNTNYAIFEGKKLPIQEISDLTGIKTRTIRHRLINGWNDYDATHYKPFCKTRITNARKKKVYLTNLLTNEVIEFKSISEASRSLGFNVGYLSSKIRKKKTNEFRVGDYYVKVEEHYYTV